MYRVFPRYFSVTRTEICGIIVVTGDNYNLRVIKKGGVIVCITSIYYDFEANEAILIDRTEKSSLFKINALNKELR